MDEHLVIRNFYTCFDSYPKMRNPEEIYKAIDEAIEEAHKIEEDLRKIKSSQVNFWADRIVILEQVQSYIIGEREDLKELPWD